MLQHPLSQNSVMSAPEKCKKLLKHFQLSNKFIVCLDCCVLRGHSVRRLCIPDMFVLSLNCLFLSAVFSGVGARPRLCWGLSQIDNWTALKTAGHLVLTAPQTIQYKVWTWKHGCCTKYLWCYKDQQKWNDWFYNKSLWCLLCKKHLNCDSIFSQKHCNNTK